MKSSIRLFLYITVLMVIPSVVISAQGEHPNASKSLEEGRPERRVKMTPEHRAKSRTDEMHEAVSLNDKQYKKIYRIFLKEENAKDSAMGNGVPMGPPQAGSEGRYQQGGGSFGGPGMGGPRAGGPPSRRVNSGGMPPRSGFPGGEPQKVTVGGKDIDSDEYIDDREAKFKKILSPDQYSTWRRIHPDPIVFFHK